MGDFSCLVCYNDIMKLSEELIWRGFHAETTIKDPATLDTRENKKFYLGADPSADSLTIGNLAALMMCATFVRHGYEPYLLVGGATGQIGDPKETGERELKPLEEVEHNKQGIKAQMERILNNAGGKSDLTMVDNLDWFRDINYLDFLRTIGKNFSMTQLLDRQFIQARIGEGGSGISYAEFSYTLIQGYDFLHLYREHGIALQLCGADQYGNCTSGIHLIRRLENGEADVWSTPLIIDPASGRKFGKSEGNAIWLAAEGDNSTSVFDFYQFWLGQPDTSVEYLIKIYTTFEREFIEDVLKRHAEAPEKRLAQKALARGVTEVVHGPEAAEAAETLTEILFGDSTLTSETVEKIADMLPSTSETGLVDALVATELASSKSEARQFITSGAISVDGEKVTVLDASVSAPAILKRGKNKFALVK